MDWSSDMCSSDLYTGKFSEDRRAALSSRAGCRAVCERTAACRHHARWPNRVCRASAARRYPHEAAAGAYRGRAGWSHHLRGRRAAQGHAHAKARSEEHTSELQSIMRNSYAVLCLKKKNYRHKKETNITTKLH